MEKVEEVVPRTQETGGDHASPQQLYRSSRHSSTDVPAWGTELEWMRREKKISLGQFKNNNNLLFKKSTLSHCQSSGPTVNSS